MSDWKTSVKACRLAILTPLATCSLLTLASPLWAAQAFQESAGQVVIDAEHYDSTVTRGGRSWQLNTTRAGFLGTSYLNVLPDSGGVYTTGYVTNSPEVRYAVAFTTTGTYRVWVRAYKKSGGNDLIHSGLDGVGPASADNITGFTYGTWAWNTSTATLNVTTAGVHTIHFWMGEDGFEFDRFVLRRSTSTTPPSNSLPESLRVAAATDTTAPTVSVTSPASGAGVGGSAVTLMASASDNVGVVGVQFKLDGANLGAEDTTSPYSVTWNTTTASGGAHTLIATARDAAGNTATSSAVSVTVDNVPPTLTITSPTDGQVIVAP